MTAAPDPLPTDSPEPFCPYCKHPITPATDVLYEGISIGSIYSIIYCGWCGAILGGGPSSGIHLLGTKRTRG
jgi:hypothetical protein